MGRGEGVTGYRLYFFDGEGRRRNRAARCVRLASNQETAAMIEAEQLRRGRYAELWRLDHLVHIFNPEER